MEEDKNVPSPVNGKCVQVATKEGAHKGRPYESVAKVAGSPIRYARTVSGSLRGCIRQGSRPERDE